MPKASTLQGSFNAGELSPLLFGRTDSPRYRQGLATCLNYIPTLQGPISRRPGERNVTNVKDSANPGVLIPFQFTATKSFIFEFGDQYIRFYTNDGQVITSGTTYSMSGNTGPVGTNYAEYTYAEPFYAIRPSSQALAGEILAGTPTTISPGSIAELQTPYLIADLPLLRWAQNGSTIYLFHPKYPVSKLMWLGTQSWKWQEVYLQDGPYLPLNSYGTVGDSTSTTLTCKAGFIGLLQLVTGPQYTVASTASSSGLIEVTTTANHSYVSGQKIVVLGTSTTADNTPIGGINPSWTINVTNLNKFVLLGSTYVSAASAGTVSPALFVATDIYPPGFNFQRMVGRAAAVIYSGIRYWGHLFDDGATSYAHEVGWAQGPNQTAILTAQTLPATAWLLGTYSQTNGYPACGTFHQDRLVLAGSPNSPQEIDGSQTGKYEQFRPSDPSTLSVVASDAFSFVLASKDANALYWLASTAQALLAGSYSSEWAITPSSVSEAISSSNVNAQQTSFFGAANADCITAGNAVLYIQRAQRKLREMNYFFQVGTFRSSDMTSLSEHITLPSINKIVHQKETQPLIWAIRSDGTLLSMIYDRSDLSLEAGWTRHQLGGQSDSAGSPPLVLSLAVIPSPDTTYDQLWLLVQRYINGQTVVGVEYMTRIFDDLSLQEDAVQLDCSVAYDNPLTISAITTANPGVFTVTAHGLSNGTKVQITKVVGMNSSSTDINGNVTLTNALNYNTFLVAGVTTNTFTLTDFQANAISTASLSAYVSGGQVRALVTHISGLTWLENETVQVLADGGIHPDVVVSNTGGITLSFPAAKVQIGYAFKSQGKLMRVEGGAADGTSIGKTRRTARAAMQVHRVAELAIGTDFSNLIPINFAQADVQQADKATPLYSGIKREGLESKYDFDSQICFQQSSALPGAIISVTSFMEEQDV
ncbi:MAG: hypothetical protein ABI351_02370 [Herbaspirillum sp.]